MKRYPLRNNEIDEKFENTLSDFIFTSIEQSLKYFQLFIDFDRITAEELREGL